MHDRGRTSRDHHLSRRRFLLHGGAAAGALGLLAHGPAGAARWCSALGGPRDDAASTLVILQLSGGNDGLSTVVPYGDDAYHRVRPSTRVTPDEVLRLDEYRGLHPALGNLRALYDTGNIAIVEGVGYPCPNRTHFESLEIWHTADLRGRAGGEGWVGRLAAAAFGDRAAPRRVVHVGDRAPYSLHSTAHPAVSFRVPRSWVSAARARPRVEYPPGPFGDALRSAAALIDGGFGTRVLSVELGGFDTHNDQRRRHDQLMRTLDAGLAAFLRDLDGCVAGRATTVLVFSEFGRRVAENGSRGTDHGVAGPVLVAGSRVRGGRYGEPPSLEELDRGDLVHTTDFRSVYATLIESLFTVDAPRILGARFPRLGFLAV